MVSSKCSRKHFISEKYKTVPSLELQFLQNNSLVQLYTFPTTAQVLETFLGAIL